MNSYVRALMIAAAVPALAVLACAAEGAAAEGLEFYPNFQTCSVYVHDAPGAAEGLSARLEYREAGGRWRRGHPLVRIYNDRWAGSIFRLDPGSDYQARVTVKTADGIVREVYEGAFTTRSDEWPSGSGRILNVAPGGTGDGTQESPFGSIQAAVDAARAGDVVLIAPGIYRETVVVNTSGTPDAYIHIQGESGAVLDGSAASFLDREGPYAWSSRRVRGRYSPYDYVADCDWQVDYVAIDDLKLYGYESLDDMMLCRSGPPGGWYQDLEAGKLYVHLTRAYASPNHSKTVVARRETGLVLNGEYILVDGLEVRYFGKRGIQVNASNNVIQDCLIHHQDVGVYIYDKDVHNTTIQDNEIYQTSVWRWPWHMTKATRYEVDNIAARAGRGTVIRGNVVHGSFDGIGLSVWEHLDEPGWIQDTDVNDNVIFNCGDDGCEPEGTCVNLRFFNNRIDNCLMVQSIAPVTVGPAWFVNETYSNGWLGVLKIKVRTSGVVNLYNCTFYSGGWRRSVWDYGGAWKNLTFRNCIFYGTDYVFSDTGPDKEGTVTFDYDCLYTTLETKFVRWEGQPYSDLDAFRAAGYEEHGIAADPAFLAPEAGDFRLAPESPCIDAGVHIPGINDDYSGDAPDIGAWESGY